MWQQMIQGLWEDTSESLVVAEVFANLSTTQIMKVVLKYEF